MVAIGPLPPPENVRAEGTAVGASVPSGFAFNVASMPRQFPSAPFTRSGTGLVSVLSVPSGLAKVRLLPVVRRSTVTGLPVLFALACAARTAEVCSFAAGLPEGAGQLLSAGPCPRSAAAGAGAGGAAAALGATSRPAPSESTATPAIGSRAARKGLLRSGVRAPGGLMGIWCRLDIGGPPSCVRCRCA